MKNIILLVLLSLTSTAYCQNVSSFISIVPTKVAYQFEDPFFPGIVEVEGTTSLADRKFNMTSLSLKARDLVIQVPSEFIERIPDPEIDTIELGFVPNLNSTFFVSLDFGYATGSDSEYLIFSIDLVSSSVSLDFVSKESLLLESAGAVN